MKAQTFPPDFNYQGKLFFLSYGGAHGLAYCHCQNNDVLDFGGVSVFANDAMAEKPAHLHQQISRTDFAKLSPRVLDHHNLGSYSEILEKGIHSEQELGYKIKGTELDYHFENMFPQTVPILPEG